MLDTSRPLLGHRHDSPRAISALTVASAYWHPFADMAAVPGHELVIARGEGVYLWDDHGQRYLDGTASLWHAHIGHGREEMAEAIAQQLRTLEAFQTFGDVANPPALELVERLVELSPMTRPARLPVPRRRRRDRHAPPSSRASTGRRRGSRSAST